MKQREIAAVCAVAIAAGMSLFGTAYADEPDRSGRTLVGEAASQAVSSQNDDDIDLLAKAKELACADPSSPSCKIGGTAIDGISMLLTLLWIAGIVALVVAALTFVLKILGII